MIQKNRRSIIEKENINQINKLSTTIYISTHAGHKNGPLYYYDFLALGGPLFVVPLGEITCYKKPRKKKRADSGKVQAKAGRERRERKGSARWRAQKEVTADITIGVWERGTRRGRRGGRSNRQRRRYRRPRGREFKGISIRSALKSIQGCGCVVDQ